MTHLERSGLLFVFLLVPVVVASAQHFVLSGYVQDATTGERLVGATLYEVSTGTGTATNTYGVFSLALPPGPAHLYVSYVGYRADTVQVTVSRAIQVTIELEPASVQLDEVEVTADLGPAPSSGSIIRIPIQQLQQLPSLLGEADLMKGLQLLPGVKSGTEGTGGLYVRGGGPDQNLILLDGIPVFNANHLFGFLSVFNSDAVKHVDLIKGGFPARYGGRLSSVVDITMKEGSMRRTAVNGSVGLITSRLTVEAPLRRDRTSFILSGRRTYLDLLARPFLSYADGKPTTYFYDASAKINSILSRRDRLYLSVYAGEDRFGADFRHPDQSSTSRLWWGNTTAALRWNRLWRPALFTNTTLLYSDYGLHFRNRETNRPGPGDGAESSGASYESDIDALGIRTDADWTPAPSHYVRFGFAVTSYAFAPGALILRSITDAAVLDTAFLSRVVKGREWSAYVEDDVRLGAPWHVNAGLHTSAFSVEGRTYGSLQPRVSLLFRPDRGWSLNVSFATMQQHLHLLTPSSGLGLPTDLWVPATRRVRPQRAWQATLGASRDFHEGRFRLSVEGYYKQMDHLIAYREGARFLLPGTDWQDMVASGRGRAYGIELLLRRTVGRTTGWIGYTASRALRRFDAGVTCS